MSDPSLPPLAPLESLGESGAWDDPVVDFAGYKSRIGRTPWGVKTCEHRSVVYSPSERRIWCDECNSPVEPFDAFMTITKHFENIVSEARADREKAREAKQAVIVRRAAKEIDRTWGHKMAPCCPHCHRGLLPHDFAGGVCSAVGQEYEEARRKKEIDN